MTLPPHYRKEAFLHGYGLAADRPTDALPGTLYYSTDVPVLERFNGITWDSYYYTLPANVALIDAVNNFSADNQFITGIYERSRSFKMGEWNPVAYNASDYYASGSMIWTVGPTGTPRHAYTIIGKTCVWSLYTEFTASALSGTASNTLYINYPGGITVPGGQVKVIDYQNGIAGVDYAAGLVGLMESTRLAIIKPTGANFALTDTPAPIFMLIFEIN